MLKKWSSWLIIILFGCLVGAMTGVILGTAMELAAYLSLQ